MLKQVGHVFQLTAPGEYCFVVSGGGIMKTILSCPYCGQAMMCDHVVVSKNPLTLRPSVVGPGEQTHCSCNHHFNVENGEARPA